MKRAMGKRSRRRDKPDSGSTPDVVDYTDPDGSVLTLRRTVSRLSGRKISGRHTGAAASVDDEWRRRTELMFERFAVSWTIAELPITDQGELLGRYRFADAATQEWVRRTLDGHVRTHQPELAE